MMKIYNFWSIEEIPIFSNNGHIELNTGLSDTALNADYPIKKVLKILKMGNSRQTV